MTKRQGKDGRNSDTAVANFAVSATTISLPKAVPRSAAWAKKFAANPVTGRTQRRSRSQTNPGAHEVLIVAAFRVSRQNVKTVSAQSSKAEET
jgi:hypothetical protein